MTIQLTQDEIQAALLSAIKQKEKEEKETLVSIKNQISENFDESEINVIIAKNQIKQDVLNPFVLLFYESFLSCIDIFNLSRSDIRVMLAILDKAKMGNLLSFSQRSIAKKLNTTEQVVSRSMNRLEKSLLIIKTDDNELYLNPQICSKGSLANIEQDIYEKSKNAMIEKQMKLNFEKKTKK